MSNAIRDLRYALRNLRGSPVFSLMALLSLALGIGANTAIFTLLDQLLLRSLPVRQPEQLVLLKASGEDMGSLRAHDEHELYFSYPMYRDLRDRNPIFNGVIASSPAQLAVSWREQTEPAQGEIVSGNYFEVLGVKPALGRLFTQSDDARPDANPVAVLSYGYWQRRFAGDPSIVNQTLKINGHPFLVIGVAAPSFRSIVVGDSTEVFTPMMMKAQITPGWNDLDERRSRWLTIAARLKPGASREQAEAAMNPLWHALREMELRQMKNPPGGHFRADFLNSHLSLLDGERGFSPLRRNLSAPLVALMGMVGLVLLIACANFANLLLARSASRQREIAVRFALGAGRLRIIRQLLVESLALSVSGGALAIPIAFWTIFAMLRLLPVESGLQLAFSAAPDSRVLAFNFLVALATGILVGLAPALQSTRADVAPALKEHAAGVVGGVGARFRRVLVASQIGFSLLLLVGAGLFARSLYNLKSLNLGFPADHLLMFTLNPTLTGYSSAQIFGLYDRLIAAMAAQPGVRAVSGSQLPLLGRSNSSSNITVAGYQAKEEENMSPDMNNIAPGFFAAVGIPLVAGRDITRQDALGAPKVAIVNETFARYFFGNTSAAVGRWFGIGAGASVKLDIQIVGVAKDAKYSAVREKYSRFVYFPYLQDEHPGGMTFYVRTWQDPIQAASAIRRSIHDLDSNLPIRNLETMDTQVNDNIWTDRVVAMLSFSFGALATLLAAIGLYGVVSYAVTRRTREIGIRMALGANRARVLRLVMSEVALLAGLGIAIAIPVSLVLTFFIKSQLFGLSDHDPITFAGAVVMLASVAALAGYLPARRATRVDPITALRYE